MPRKVLLLEDEVLIGLDLESQLADMGFEVTNTLDEASALAAERTTDFILAILDLHIRGKVAADLIGRLRAKRVPIIICSGSSGETVPDLIEGLPYLSKPYSEADIRRTVNELVGL